MDVLPAELGTGRQFRNARTLPSSLSVPANALWESGWSSCSSVPSPSGSHTASTVCEGTATTGGRASVSKAHRRRPRSNGRAGTDRKPGKTHQCPVMFRALAPLPPRVVPKETASHKNSMPKNLSRLEYQLPVFRHSYTLNAQGYLRHSRRTRTMLPVASAAPGGRDGADYHSPGRHKCLSSPDVRRTLDGIHLQERPDRKAVPTAWA